MLAGLSTSGYLTCQVTYQVQLHLIRRSSEACRARRTKLVHEEAHLLVSYSL